MAKARDAGVICTMFGVGVGNSTINTPYPDTYYPPANATDSGASPGDGYWWIDKVHKYNLQPVSIP